MSEQEPTLTHIQAGLKLSGAILLTAVLLILGLYYAPPPFTAALQTTLQTWLTQFITHLPLLVLGALTAGFLAVFVPPATLQPLIPRRWPLQLLLAAVLGLVLPFGLFGNLPVARQLHHKGLPSGMTITFLLAAAVINPLTLLDSWVTLGAALTLGRVGLALLIALTAGVLFTRLSHTQPISRPPHLLAPATGTRLQKAWAALARGGDEVLEFGAYFVIGSLLTAVVETFLPQNLLFDTAVGITLLGFLSPPQPFLLSDTAVWLVRALPTGAALAYLTSNSLLPLSAAILHTRLWHGRWLLLLVALTLALALLVALLL